MRITGLILAIAIMAAAHGKEASVKAKAADIAKVVKAAPKLPKDLGLGLKMKLVDFVDFTNPNDPHDMLDRGTSKIVTGPAGKYRVTASHRHAQFAVRWRRGDRDKPHVLVFEYPDDAKREICFFTHESPLSGRKNIDWSLETGVYSGDPLPVSNKMQYHTFFFWPSDTWPVAMVMNWARSGAPAAASRLWVYQVDGELPGLKVKDADPASPRLLGTIYNWSLVPTRGIFGLTSRDTAMKHIVTYHRYRGDNVICWPVVSNNSWGFRCTIPAWDGGDRKTIFHLELDNILAECEKQNMKFLPVFNVGHRFKIGGRTYAPGNKAYADGLEKGYEQFLQRYGKSKALLGIAFDTQDLSPHLGVSGLDSVRDCFGSIDKFTEFVKERAPQLKVYNYLGGKNIHKQYFQDAGQVIKGWEASQTNWGDYLAADIAKQWTSWRRDPKELNAAKGLTTVIAYQHDDHAIFDEYAQNPRAMYYYDLEASPAKSKLINTRAALVWNTFFEGYIGLNKNNWWYQKVWVAPDFNPPAPHALAGWTRTMSHRDRDMIMCGSWNRKGGGHEVALRRFAREFRSLPPTELKAKKVSGDSPVLLRVGTYKGKTYASLLNQTPYPAAVTVTMGMIAHRVVLDPFAIKTLTASGAVSFSAIGDANPAYVKWLKGRFDDYEKVLAEVKALNPAAAPAVYAQHVARARKLFDAKKYTEADVELGFGLAEELKLRKRILQPPVQPVPRISSKPAMNGDLNAWPTSAAKIQTTDANLGTHLWFTSQWEGPKDLSASVRLGHDGQLLYFAVAVSDNMISAKDALGLKLSPKNYKVWLPQTEKYEIGFNLGLPTSKDTVTGVGAHKLKYTSRRSKDGYVVEGSVSMQSLGLKAGDRIGWAIQVSDDDKTSHLANGSWARKSILLIPNVPAFTYWNDARTCGELLLER